MPCVLHTDHQVRMSHLLSFFYPEAVIVKSQMCDTAIYYHLGVVTVYYHWRVGVYCRKELDNFQVEAASVEPGKETEKGRKEKTKQRKKGKKKRITSLFSLLFALNSTLLP